MTIPESPGGEAGGGETLRGAVLILVVGIALGIAYNALGLASHPRRGVAWISRPQTIESLEALQSATSAPASASSRSPAAHDSTGTPAPAAPTAATTKEPSKPSPARATGPQHATPPATAASPAQAGSAPGATTSSHTAHASAPSRTGSGASGMAPATADHAGAPTSTATSTSPAPAQAPAQAAPAATKPAAADLPVIPDVPGPLKLELATFKRLYDANAALVLDAREAAEYADGHIGGAISLPYNDAMADPDRVSHLDSGGRPIVAYCSGGDCELSMDLAKLLVQSGKRKVLVYQGGFPEWQSAGYPVARGPNP